MAGTTRFDCYPNDFLNGVIGRTADEIAVYTIIIMLQYDRGGPVAYHGHERELALRAGLTKGRLAKAVSELVLLGKLFDDGAGLSNRRAEQELGKISENSGKNRENSKKGGEATRAKWEEIRNKNKDDEGQTASQTASRLASPIPSPSPSPIPTSLRSVGASEQVEPKSTRRKNPRTQIAEDAQPNERQRLDAEATGLDSRQFRDEWRRFRDHHRANGNLKADWPAAWRTWLGNIAQFQRPPSRAGPQQTRSEPASFLQAGRELIDQLQQAQHDERFDHTEPEQSGDAPVACGYGGGSR